MKRAGIAVLIIVAIAEAAAAVSSGASSSESALLPLKQVARVTLPGPSNRFDYASLDSTTGRLYIAHMNAGQLLVFDVHSRKVVRTIAAPGVHGVIVVPQLHRVYASATGVRKLLTIDSRTGRVLNRAPAGSYPDGLVYDPAERHVFVSDERGGIESVFDVAGKRIATVQLGGEAGNVGYDSASGTVLAAVQSRNQLAVINPRSNRVIRRVALADCKHPHGLLVDARRRLAYIACDRNATLVTLDLKRMKVTGRVAVGSGPDVLTFDRSLGRLYVAAESGEVAVLATGTRGLTKLGQGFVAPGAHTVAVDPRTHLVYFPLARGSAGRPELLITRPGLPDASAPPIGGTEQAGGPVPPPAQPGAWKQIGQSVTADPGNPLHFFRTPLNPQTLGVVVTSPSPSAIRVVWSSYCEFSSDDDKTLEDGGTVTGVQTVTAYPPSFPGATLCYVSVSAYPSGSATITAAIFAT